MVVGEDVVFQTAAGQAEISVDAGGVAAGRPQGVVGFVATPADIAFNNPVFLAVFLDELAVAIGLVGFVTVQLHGEVFYAEAEVYAVIFGNRHTHARTEADTGGFVVVGTGAGAGFIGHVAAIVDIVAQAHAVRGEVGVGKRQGRGILGFAARNAEVGRFARTKQVVLRHACRKYQTGILYPTGSHFYRTGRALFHGYIHIHLVGRIGQRAGFHFHIIEIAQELDAVFGAVELGRIVGSRFGLAHFAADNGITGFVVAGNVDLVHIVFAAGIHR